MECPFWKGAFCLLRHTSYLLIKMGFVLTCSPEKQKRPWFSKACFRFHWVGLLLPPSATEVCVLERSLSHVPDWSTDWSELLWSFLLLMNFGFNSEYFSGRTGEDGQPRCCLIKYCASVGFWVNKIVNKLLKLNWKVVVELASSNSWLELQVFFLRRLYTCYNCIPNNMCVFLILRFFLPSVIPLKEILVKKWTSYSQRIWHWQNEALPYVVRKHNCSMSKKKSLLFVLEHVFSFFFFKPSLLDWY